jgi:hypothetical protein
MKRSKSKKATKGMYNHEGKRRNRVVNNLVVANNPMAYVIRWPPYITMWITSWSGIEVLEHSLKRRPLTTLSCTSNLRRPFAEHF